MEIIVFIVVSLILLMLYSKFFTSKQKADHIKILEDEINRNYLASKSELQVKLNEHLNKEVDKFEVELRKSDINDLNTLENLYSMFLKIAFQAKDRSYEEKLFLYQDTNTFMANFLYYLRRYMGFDPEELRQAGKENKEIIEKFTRILNKSQY